MLRTLLLCLTTIAVGWAVGVPTASAQAPTQDSVVGGGVLNYLANGEPSSSFGVDARSDPDGSNPTGNAGIFIRAQPPLNGPVTCMTVVGNRAMISFNDNTVFPPTGEGGTIIVEDNGITGPTVRDRAVFRLPGACRPPTDADFADPSPFGHSLLEGDVTVVDAQPPPPLPTTKDQCKNGGWRNFPGFKNEGACVAFVATGGRRQPAG